MFIPDGIQLYELLPKYFYEKYYPIEGEKLWMMFDYHLLFTLHHMRKKYGTVILNDWKWGGVNNLRGWRPIDSDTGAFVSQHKFGRAGDMKFKYFSPEEVRSDILEAPYAIPFKYITCIEMDISWVHIDVGNRVRPSRDFGNDVIQKVYPKRKEVIT